MMMKALFLMLTPICSFGQILFEKGYFVDNNAQRIECLIKNIDWKNNPSKFLYKPNGSDSVKEGNLNSVKEFGVYGYSRFLRADVKIDRTKVMISDLTNDRNPIWSQEKLFLKVLIDSKASLYSYEDNSITRFFYSLAASPITQLVCKNFLVDMPINDGLTYRKMVSTNNYFRQQLWTDVRCEETKLSSVEKIKYNARELEKYFNNFNNCGNSTKTAEVKTKRNSFNIKIAPGINYSSFRTYGPSANDYNKTFNFRLGLEFEYVLPFNKNKWSIVFEPTFQALNTEVPQTAKLNYSSIEFPVGLRYYFFLNNNSKIFLNGYYVTGSTYDFSNSTINLRYPPGNTITTLDIKNSYCFAAGLGIELKRISFEARYYDSRNLLADYLFWSSDYRRMTLIIGYKVFKRKTKAQD